MICTYSFALQIISELEATKKSLATLMGAKRDLENDLKLTKDEVFALKTQLSLFNKETNDVCTETETTIEVFSVTLGAVLKLRNVVRGGGEGVRESVSPWRCDGGGGYYFLKTGVT